MKICVFYCKVCVKVLFLIVVLVGYINVGKLMLFNCVIGVEVFVKDMLFVMFDFMMCRVDLFSGDEVILFDMVGFIFDLLIELVVVFCVMFEEVFDVDLILYVWDISYD